MFTGLVEEIGTIKNHERIGDSLRLTIAARADGVLSDARHGDSISVSGVCLTLVNQSGGDAGSTATFTADVMAQTLRMSTLGELVPGSRVNLERAARVDSRLGGHIVQGHIDGTAELLSRTEGDAWRVLRFSLPDELAPLLVDKGSVTLSGVSLTVSAISAAPASLAADGRVTDGRVAVPVTSTTARSTGAAQASDHWFEVSLIPETLAATTLGDLEVGDRVNLETDIIARHVARMLRFPTPTAEGVTAS